MCMSTPIRSCEFDDVTKTRINIAICLKIYFYFQNHVCCMMFFTENLPKLAYDILEAQRLYSIGFLVAEIT